MGITECTQLSVISCIAILQRFVRERSSRQMTMKGTLFLLIIIALATLVVTRHSLDQLSALSPAELEDDSLVEVTESGSTKMNNKVVKDYYIIKVGRKNKKDAYNIIQKIFYKVVDILLKNKIIPDQSSLVKSKIKPQYQSKKRSWVFSTIFVVLGTQKELERAFKHLSRIGVQRLQTKPSINFLNQKLQAMELFNSAKSKLAAQLERIDFEIKSVQEIEIHGKEVQNSDIIEQQLQEDFNEESENMEENDIAESVSASLQEKLEMKIVFRVGLKSEESSDDDDDDEDNSIGLEEAESQSSDEDTDDL